MFKRYKNHTVYSGFHKKLQGFGFKISFDNPIWENEYMLIEIYIFYYKFKYYYDIIKQK